MPKHALQQTDLIELADLLRRVCIRANDGSATYAAGWSDDRIATESGGKFILTNVSGLRRRLIGELPQSRRAATLVEMQQRLEALEAWAALRPVKPFVPAVSAK